MSKLIPFDSSIASIEECLEALEHRDRHGKEEFGYFSHSFSPKYSHNTTTSEKLFKCKHEKEIAALKHDIDGLKTMFLEKSDQISHLEALFHKALNQISIEVEGIDEKSKKILQIEARITKKIGKIASQHAPAGTALQSHRNFCRSPGDFSFSNKEGDETSNFSFGQTEENAEVFLPHEKDCEDFEEYLKKQSFAAEKLTGEDENFHGTLTEKLKITDHFFISGAMISDKYRTDNVISAGSYSTVLQCFDVIEKKKVCLKVIHSQKETFDQGLDEIKAMNTLQKTMNKGQKNVVKMIEFFYYNDSLILVYELLGESLAKLNLSAAFSCLLSNENISKIAKHVLSALSFIHNQGVFHGNLNPRHILLASPVSRRSAASMEVKIIDFTNSFSAKTIVNNYKSPEVLISSKFTQKLDVWSLGCILAELLTGEMLFPGTSPREVLLKIKSFNSKGKDLVKFLESEKKEVSEDLFKGDKCFEEFLRTLLSVNPEERPSADKALSHPFITQYLI